MTSVQLSIVQMSSAHLQPSANIDQIEAWVAEESAHGADFVVFPELATTGYIEPVMPSEQFSPGVTGDNNWPDFLAHFTGLAETIPGPSTDRLTGVARHHGVRIAVGMLEAVPRLTGVIANTVVVIGPHGVIGLQRKLHMPWNEKHVFMPGNELNIIDLLGLRVGINVCYDAYFPEQTRALTLRGAELIISCFTGPKRSGSESGIPVDRASVLARTRAMENSIFFAAVNRVGQQGPYFFIGNSAIAGPDGSIIASTESCEPQAVRAELNLKEVTRARLGLSLLKDRRPELYGELTRNWDAAATAVTTNSS